MQALADIQAFLGCPSPDSWLQYAARHQAMLLLDHAHCEKKAATSALGLMHHYPQHYDLLQKMSRLAREELSHFEKVLSLMDKRDIAFKRIPPGRYASDLRQHAHKDKQSLLTDLLIIGAIIEARSCERFASLIDYVDNELADFYQRLLVSEARHFQDYLDLAKQYADEDLAARIQFFIDREVDLIMTPDPLFRFHSGVPSSK